MAWCKVALITTFAVLLQCELQHAASCEGRKTVIQIRIPGKTNINIKYPSKSDPVKFVPYPYPNSEGQYNGDCFTCNGPRCQKCSTSENQIPFTIKSQGKDPLRTNIIIDITRKTSDAQNESNNNQPTGGIPSKDGTVVVLQDSNSASSASKSATSDSSRTGGQESASSASSATISNTDIVASFDPNSSAGQSVDNTEDIFVQDTSQSTAGSAAVSKVISNLGTSLITGNGGVASSGGAAVAKTDGTSSDAGALTKLIVKTKPAIEDGDEDGVGDGTGTISAISNAAAEALDGFD